MRTKLPAGNPVAECAGTPGRWSPSFDVACKDEIWWDILWQSLRIILQVLHIACRVCLNMFELKASTFLERSISEIERAPNLGVTFPFAPLPGHFFDEQIANLAACSRLDSQTTRQVLVVMVMHRLVCSFRFCFRLSGPESLVRGGRVGVWPREDKWRKITMPGARGWNSMKFTFSSKTNYVRHSRHSDGGWMRVPSWDQKKPKDSGSHGESTRQFGDLPNAQMGSLRLMFKSY